MTHVKAIAPCGPLSQSISDAQAERRYLARFDRDADTIVHQLAEIARRHPGQQLVVLCFEDVHRCEV